MSEANAKQEDGDGESGAGDGEKAPKTNAVEDRAKSLGWRPKDTYKGGDDHFVDAESFIKQTEEDMPRIRRVNQHLERKVDKLEKGIESIISHQSRELKVTKERAYEQAQKDLQEQQAKAVEEGDAEGVEELSEAREKLAKDHVKEANKVDQPKGGEVSQGEAVLLQQWYKDNSWYNDDPMLAEFATKKENSLAAKGMALEDRLKETTAYIKKRFPNDFKADDDESEEAPMQTGKSKSSVVNNKTPKEGSYEALKPEFKTECDRSLKMHKGMTKENWLEYAEPNMFVQK